MKTILIFTAIYYVIFFPCFCFSLELTLNEAVKLALKNNTDVRINALELNIRESEIKRKKAEYIPTFHFDSSYKQTENDPDFPDLTIKNQNYQAGITQKIPLGGELSLSVNYGKFDYSSYQSGVTHYRLGPGFFIEPFTDTQIVASRDNYYTEINLFYTHRLLKDGIIGPAFAPIKESRISKEVQHYAVKESQMKLINMVEITFFETALRQKESKIYKEILDINENLLKNIQAKQQLGLAPEIDILSAQIEVNTAKEELLSSLSLLETSTQTLKTLLNTDLQINVVSTFKINKILPGLEDSISKAKNNNKEILKLKNTIEKQALTVSVAKNRYLPQVDIYAGLNKQDWGNSFGNDNDLRKTEYLAGFVFSYPLFNTDPIENYNQEEKRLEQTKLQLREAEIKITNQVNMLVRQLGLVKDKLKIQSRQVKILKERMELSLKAFQERLIDLKRLYDIQDDLVIGEQKFLYYLFEYQRMHSSLKELTGKKPDLTDQKDHMAVFKGI